MSARRSDGVPEDRLVAVVEALIFSSGEPVAPEEIAGVLDGLDRERVLEAVRDLERRYDASGSGLRVEMVAGGVQLATRSDVGPWVRKFFRQRHRTRISPASLETLAVIAYRQPVTAPEIQAIRGKDPSATLETLLEKKLIRILGKKKVVGRPILYGTSRHFLIHFGLNGLDDLPAIEEFEEMAGALDAFRAAAEEEGAEEDGAGEDGATDAAAERGTAGEADDGPPDDREPD